MIDLGLPSGTKWACCNVDDDHSKQSPINYGGYYAWGEVEEKDYYEWSNYQYWTDNNGSGSVEFNEITDLGSDIAGTQYDVAHYQWGDSWVMPSMDQFEELLDNCTYEMTTVNGVKGGKFTSKTSGGSIFLPATGGSRGSYWLSTLYPSDPSCAFELNVTSGLAYLSGLNRYVGQPVRPVSK